MDIADEELMSEYSVNGCTKSFARLYNRHKAPVYRYFLRQTNAQSLAEELLQEVWIKIIKSAENYTQSAKFTTYLYKIARNILIDHLRKASTKTADLMINSDHDYENDLQDSNTNPELIAITSENSQKLLAAINHLPADQKEVFLLRVDAGLTFKEIAETTGCGHEAVKSRFRYAAKKLTYLVAEG